MKKINYSLYVLCATVALFGCKFKNTESAVSGDAATKVYVAPGKYDEFYNFVSGGFSGNVTVYGLPSGRLLKVIPVFSDFPENGYGFSEETKPMLNTTAGHIPWDDQHHLELSQTNGEYDGRWLFANANNTPRVARIDLKTFKTVEILQIPNSAGNHSSPFITENTEYVVAGTRFSVPLGDQDVPISSFKKNFKSTISFIAVDKNSGRMNIAFQIALPGMNLDLSHAGKGPSHDWFFFSSYNTEQAYTLLEVNASQRDKDYIVALNWKKAEAIFKAGKGKKMQAQYAHNVFDEDKEKATSTIENEVTMLDIKDLEDAQALYMIPCPKSPHGCDIDPTGEYIVGSGKLAALIPVFSFTKIQSAIQNKQFEGDFYGIQVIKYEAALHGEVKKPGLGPLHTEFDGKGNAYTSMFLSSEIVKWSLKDLTVIDRSPTFYSTGHLMVPGGDTRKPYGKYLVAYNKITKDRYLPTGPELCQSAQLFDISGDKMELILDFPTIGEPHYGQACPASLIKDQSVKFYDINKNHNEFHAMGEKEAKVVRTGNRVDVYMTAIRSHLVPDNIEGVFVGDEVYFHVTNLEQDWDIPHGFAIKNNPGAELLIMPGETCTLKYLAEKQGITPFYCTDFCSALHQEMSGYLRISPKGANVPLKFGSNVIDSTTAN